MTFIDQSDVPTQGLPGLTAGKEDWRIQGGAFSVADLERGDWEEPLSCGWRAISLTGRSRCRVVGEPSHLPGAG